MATTKSNYQIFSSSFSSIRRTPILFTLIISLLLSCTKQKSSTTHSDHLKSATSSKKGMIQFSSNQWLLNEGLNKVESIIYDEVNQVFYASNGKDYKPGEDGFISKISDSGELLDLHWIKNLNRPTGMAVKDSLLYVADVNSLVLINTNSGKIIDTFLAPVPNPGLNDVTINNRSEVYVSASFLHSLFKLGNKELELWLEDEEQLKWANGLASTDSTLIVAGLKLCSVNIYSKEITPIKLNNPIKDFDGIVSDGKGGFFLTTVENSGLYHLDSESNITTILEEESYFGDIDYNSKEQNIYIPRGNNALNEYFISVLRLDSF